MFNIKNVEYQRSEKISNIFSDDMFTIIDDKSCRELYNPEYKRKLNYGVTPINKGNGCIILGAIVPSKVKRYRDYDFHAKIVITPTENNDYAWIQDKVDSYPGHQLMYFIEKNTPDDEDIKKSDIVGGLLVKETITDFMNDFKKKENQFFRIKLRGVFEIPKFHYVWIYVANASQYNYTSQQDMEEIFKKIK